jgi:hypothetical protein
MANDGYIYRLIYYKYESDGETITLVSRNDTEYLDQSLDFMLGFARHLTADDYQVTLMRKRAVPQPPWERVEL